MSIVKTLRAPTLATKWAASVLAALTLAVSLPTAALAQAASAPPAAAAPASAAPPAAAAPAVTEEAIDNPYGLKALWFRVTWWPVPR